MIVSARSAAAHLCWDRRHEAPRTRPLPRRDGPEASEETPPPPTPGRRRSSRAPTPSAPAPTEGRGPKLQRASRSLAIASAQFLLIAAAVVVAVLGARQAVVDPAAHRPGPAHRHGAVADHPVPPQAPVATGAGRLDGAPGRGRALRRDHRGDRAVRGRPGDRALRRRDHRAAGRPGMAAGPAVQLRRGPDRQRRRLGDQLDPGQRAEHRRVRVDRRLRRRQQPDQPGPGAGAGLLLPQGRPPLRALAVRPDRPAGRTARGRAVLQVLGHPVGVHPPAGPGRLHRRVLHRPRACGSSASRWSSRSRC